VRGDVGESSFKNICYAFGVVVEGELVDQDAFRVHDSCPALPIADVYAYVLHLLRLSTGFGLHTLIRSRGPRARKMSYLEKSRARTYLMYQLSVCLCLFVERVGEGRK